MSTKKTTGTTKRAAKPKAEAVDEVTAVEVEIKEEPAVGIQVEETVRSAPAKRPEVSLNDLVYVQSCFHGNLFYKSKRNGSIVEWQRFGEEQPMDVDELMYMRNTQPTFFKEQWIRLVGDNAEDVFNFLRLDRYCKTPLDFDDFDDLFNLDPLELERTVKEFIPSLRESFARRAAEKIEDDSLANLKVIKAIERVTGFELLK